MTNPLVTLTSVSPSLVLDIRYATNDNFLGKQIYSLPAAFLRRSVAQRLHRVQEELMHRGLGLKIWDAYRPLSVQQALWQVVPDSRYVADPLKGSMHNRGAAVDVTLVDLQGHELSMPTGFDDFTERAHLSYQPSDLISLTNRQILTDVMSKYGFQPLTTEWWHFDDPEASSCPLESISFEDLLKQEQLLQSLGV